MSIEHFDVPRIQLSHTAVMPGMKKTGGTHQAFVEMKNTSMAHVPPFLFPAQYIPTGDLFFNTCWCERPLHVLSASPQREERGFLLGIEQEVNTSANTHGSHKQVLNNAQQTHEQPTPTNMDEKDDISRRTNPRTSDL